MMYKTYDEIMQTHPTHRFVFLTLTVRNPKIEDLRETLQHMNKSWQRLKDRKSLYQALRVGYAQRKSHAPKTRKDKDKKYKRVCPTTGNTHAHPHFHVILMVKPSYFGKGYIKQSRWQELWADCLRVDYLHKLTLGRLSQEKRRW